MIFKSIRLVNFRQFKGNQKIEFSCDSDKNITVILGDNTSGKTTLLQAFNWCLYGIAEFETNDFLLNIDISRELSVGESASVEVEIKLIHDGLEYTILRVQEYCCDQRSVRPTPVHPAKVSYLKPDGQYEQMRTTDAKSKIKEILPEQLADYFFFDTERIGKISSKQDVNEAVKGLLGLATLDNTLQHLGNKNLKRSVLGKLYAALNTEGDKQASDALSRIQSLTDRINAIKERIDQIDDEVAKYDERKTYLERIILDNRDTQIIQAKKNNLESTLKLNRVSLEKKNTELVTSFLSNTFHFFSQPLMTKAENILHEADVSDKGAKEMNAKTISALIKRGHCVCGTEIIEGNEAWKHLIDELQYLPPKSLGIIIQTFKDQIKIRKSTNPSYYQRMVADYGNILELRKLINDQQYELDDYSTQIRGHDDMGKHEDEIRQIKSRLKDFFEKKLNLNREEGSCSADIERHKKIYEALLIATGKNVEILEYIQYAETIKNWIEKDYYSSEAEIKNKLEDKVNEIFNQMYHGRRKVSIDEKYRVSLLTSFDDVDIHTDESKGLETVKNFAFIAGLVALARDQILSEKDQKVTGIKSEPYPLVMDAPFSNADEKHVRNISKVLPSIAEQIIMFVMEKDWRYAEPVMASRTGYRYELNKKSETITELV